MADVRQGMTQQNPTASQPRTQDDESSRAMERRRSPELSASEWTSPFSFMRRFVNDIDRMFEDFGMGSTGSSRQSSGMTRQGTWSPQMDIFERDGKLVLHADLPGMRENDVHVQVDSGVLTIWGERKHQHEHEKGGVYRCERSYGSFQRSVTLPEGVAPESIQASFENGVLEVTMPAPKQTPRGRTVPIQAKQPGVTH